MLGAAGVLLIQATLIAYFASTLEAGPDNNYVGGGDGKWILASLAMIAFVPLMIWSAFALAIKRLHDLDLPWQLAILLVFPPICYVTFVYLAMRPSKQVTNRHGPPPFPE